LAARVSPMELCEAEMLAMIIPKRLRRLSQARP
jgi:hypothetical protein